MKEKFMGYIVKLITMYIPRHGKRLLALVMYYLMNNQTKSSTTQRHDLIEINNKMMFSRSEEAIQFALEFGRFIMNNSSVIINPSERQFPTWLKYTSYTNIFQDLDTLEHAYRH